MMLSVGTEVIGAELWCQDVTTRSVTFKVERRVVAWKPASAEVSERRELNSRHFSSTNKRTPPRSLQLVPCSWRQADRWSDVTNEMVTPLSRSPTFPTSDARWYQPHIL